MILTIEAKENWETYPDEKLKELGFDAVREAIKTFTRKVNDDDWVYYPFACIYDEPAIKGKVPEPKGELLDAINEWEKKAMHSN